jgi:hypothetical protein
VNKTTVLADGVDAITVSGILGGTLVWWTDGGEPGVVDADGEVSFSTLVAGDHHLVLDHPHYLKEEVHFVATQD